ncbi:MAG: hypothetical protein A2W36_04065 [Chloroflexi bacterium RBG_16_58_14]|nr:MAG: hypothetical protein A2W36_04065 [Chloroflexi bacterium RBG_16_58_14]
MSTAKKGTIAFLIIVLIYTLYAVVYIYRTSFVVNGERYFVLFDDAMISMRFAKNLAHGYGLVWNPGGERIEGYTNPLWVVFMALFHLFPIPLSKTSLFLQASGAILLGANLYFVNRITLALSKSTLAAVFAMLLTAFYSPLNNWGLQGMEVSALTLIVSAALWLSLENLRLKRFTPWLYLLLGAGTLVRLDAAVPYLIILVFFVIFDPAHRRRHLAWGVGLFALFLGGQTLLRWVYYGDLLPNTYYLKMTGYPDLFRIGRGLFVLFQFTWQFNWLLFLFPLTLLFFRRDRYVGLLFLLFLGQLAYSVYVGGDAWEHKGGSNRYFSIVMPVFFVLFVYAADCLFKALAARVRADARRARFLAQVVLTIFVLASMVQFNTLLGEVRDLERWLLLRQPTFVEGNKETVRIALDLAEITRPDATVAVVAAGALPYFVDRPAIDLLGKVDRKIARQPAHAVASLYGIKNFRPGHVKYDYDYSLGQLKPDVIAQIFGEKEVARAYIDQYYTIGSAGGELTYSLRTDSPKILWDKVQLYNPAP